jgi:hypothetical protein
MPTYGSENLVTTDFKNQGPKAAAAAWLRALWR